MILKVEFIGFADGFNVGCEKTREIKSAPKIFVLNNWKNRIAIYWDKGDYGRSRFGFGAEIKILVLVMVCLWRDKQESHQSDLRGSFQAACQWASWEGDSPGPFQEAQASKGYQ